MDFDYGYAGRTFKVSIKEEKNTFKVVIDGNEVVSEVLIFNQGFLKFSLGNRTHKAVVSKEGDKRNVFIDGMVYRLAVPARIAAKKTGGPKAEGNLNSPISGKVVKVMVKEGDTVEEKQDLMIIEAMKMEHKIKAPYPGKVRKVNFTVDDRVDIGQLLLDIERTGPPPAEGGEEAKKA
jgi:biotin carboxyl carrier protein